MVTRPSVTSWAIPVTDKSQAGNRGRETQLESERVFDTLPA